MEGREGSSTLQENGEIKTNSSSKKIQIFSIAASVFLPIVAAYIVFYTGVGIPDGTTNQGELLQPPINFNDLKISSLEEETQLIGGEHQKWRYLIISPSDCGEDCEKLLYTSRQVHIRLGEKASRVERLLATHHSMTEEKKEKLQLEHPRLKIFRLNDNSVNTLHELTDHKKIDDVKAILIDQEGFAMMIYDNQHSGNQLLKDIKRLLKYSYEK
ncbi:hypothetical protein [Microbulbifer sp. CnH-101-E]|uniref:hypothetical protein n=1 Tax=unclassified Microbulbifer TaxID=2619833 RepID=UPI00403A3403